MMASTHHHIRYCLPFIRIVCGEPGLPVLIALISHANNRGRAYPSYQGLTLVTGLSRPSISKAVQGLIDLGIIRVIAISERSEEEKELDTRLNVYELSGYMKIGDLVIPFMTGDYTKKPIKFTDLEEFEWEQLVNDVNSYQLTTFTDIVNHVYSKKIYHKENIPLKKKRNTKTLVAPTETTVEIPPIEPPKTKPKRAKKDTPPAVLVNMTNAKLGRPRPDGYTDADYQEWLKQKPIWELFRMWEVWNNTQGWADRSVANYEAKAPRFLRDKMHKRIQTMGYWLDAIAEQPDVPTITYELLRDFDDWYHSTIWARTPVQEHKYPTSREAFETNLGKYLTYIAQPEMA